MFKFVQSASISAGRDALTLIGCPSKSFAQRFFTQTLAKCSASSLEKKLINIKIKKKNIKNCQKPKKLQIANFSVGLLRKNFVLVICNITIIFTKRFCCATFYDSAAIYGIYSYSSLPKSVVMIRTTRHHMRETSPKLDKQATIANQSTHSKVIY